MSFRKRNVGISSPSLLRASPNPASNAPAARQVSLPPERVDSPVQIPGVRPSPIDGRPTTSTGTASLDYLLAGHGGLALGCSLLIEESGTTDFGGALLRYYAAEGVVQAHQIHVFGVGPNWGRELPGLLGPADDGEDGRRKERMKIAWRYERLGDFSGAVSSRVSPVQGSNVTSPDSSAPKTFCHSFDLTKRLSIPPASPINFMRPSQGASPYDGVIETLHASLRDLGPKKIHRLIIPTLLSPIFYPAEATIPSNLLQFLHSLRGLLRSYPTQLSAIISIPLELYSRSTGLVRWVELLSDGVMELTPFPHVINKPQTTNAGAATTQEDQPQGLIKFHSLPIFHERGGGMGGAGVMGDDLAFIVSRKKFVIKPFSLPPVDGDSGDAKGQPGEEPKQTKVDVEF
ncbi:MAG: hypothetical protein M1829_004881 [Trizodia sp. TS-e1964]|nr:MAG: hypothetical protein M1829_004881 [Trizodia sp. TS-e1964]